jgi:hypothetical protein
MSSAATRLLPPAYKSPVLLNARDHSALTYRKPATYNFARKLNTVPVVLGELANLLPYYPVAFTTGPNPSMIALLGARNEENLYIGPNGEWDPSVPYIPAYLRRYPFIMMEMPDKQHALSAELDPEFFGSEGETLFADGKPTKIAQAALQFCAEFQQAFDVTRSFSEAVLQTGILRNKRTTFTLAGGSKINLIGFSAADEEALDELDNRTTNTFRKKHWLGPLYLHMASLVHLNSFPGRIAANAARRAA